MTTALIVVDVQNDFVEGSLPVPGGAACAERIGRYLRDRAGDYAVVVTTQDWHVDPGPHFAQAPDFVDSWPAHCVADTPGAELHPGLAAGLGAPVADVVTAALRKGRHEAAYSGFQATADDGRGLDELLKEAGVSGVHVVGLASSHCVAATALDALALGYRTTVLTDLAAGVSPELEAAAYARITETGGLLRTSDAA
ncbi:MAG: isochorismatase family protein [Kineosporiaceae bacterium]